MIEFFGIGGICFFIAGLCVFVFLENHDRKPFGYIEKDPAVFLIKRAYKSLFAASAVLLWLSLIVWFVAWIS